MARVIGDHMRRTLYTIGYEGSDISRFIDTLVACGVEKVLDIRDVPVSRKPGFSKSSLMAALGGRGIRYCHLKALGDPKPGRDAMRRGDYPAFVKVFTDHLAGEAAQNALRDAIEQASAHICVLLCFERSPKECHRTIVASEMERAAGFEIRDIGVNAPPVPAKPALNANKRLAELNV
jgi:uncharacterized protein (DUF488 family)